MQIDEYRQDFMPGDHMAQNDINIGLNVTSNGSISKENDEAQKLAASLQKAEKAAGGTSKALAAAKQASLPAAKTKAPTPDEGIQYGISRAAGGTGAASRDFAKQSQGLGGLVRLYATFAANIFALTAAFTALSNAADTSNLVKGLDQLGAASGRALGTLAKELALASDGAISLRDSMESVAKASSAGLSNKQILALGESAKQASQALGLSMPDALNRLTRGIAKLEPELLDELGIFVKIDDATRKYGLSVGKSAASLSDFERRQAFANAVLDQAKDKFGEIKLDVNPYSKLLAAFQNLSFAGLELVNKVLGPLVKLLAESPTAFSTLLGAIGLKLLSTAIPAIGQWRLGLKSAAEDAAKTADAITKSFGDQFVGKLEASFRIPGLERNLAAARKQVEAFQKNMPSLPPVPTTIANRAYSNASDDEKGLNAVNRALKKKQDNLAAVAAQEKSMSANAVANTKREVDWLEKKQASILKTIELRKLENKEQLAANALTLARDSALIAADKAPGRFDTEKLALDQAEKARLKYDKLSAVSNAAENARILGIKLAWQALNNEVSDKGITGISKYTTLATGGLAAVGTRVVGIAASFANLIPVLASAYVAYEVLAAIFSDNAKEVNEFNSGAEGTNKAVKTLEATLDKISKKDALASINAASTLASATALDALAESTEDLVKALAKADKASGWFDRLIDGQVLTPLGKDLRSKFTKEFVPSLVETFESLPESAAKTEYQEKLLSILSVSDISIQGIQNSLNKLDPSKLLELTAEAAKAQKAVTESFKRSADSTQGFKEAMDGSVKAYQEFSLSLASSDPIGKLGQSLMTSGQSLNSVINNSTTAITGLVEILGDTTKLSLLPENSRELLMAYSGSIKETQENIQNYTKSIREAEKKLLALKKVQEDSTFTDGGTGRKIIGEDTSKDQAKISQEIERFNAGIQQAKDAQLAIINEFKDAGKEVFETGVKLLTRQIEAAKSSAASTILKAQTAQATGFAKIGIDAGLQKQEIDNQVKLINVQEQLVVAQTKTNLLLNERNLLEKRDKLLQTTVGGIDGAQLASEYESLTRQLGAISELLGRLNTKGINLDGISPAAAAEAGPLYAQSVASRAKRIELGAQSEAVDITKQQQVDEQRFQNRQKSKKSEEEILLLEKQRLTNILSIVGVENTGLVLEKQRVDALAQTLAITQEYASLTRSLDQAKEIASKAGPNELALANEQVMVLQRQLETYTEIANTKSRLALNADRVELIESASAKAAKEYADAVALQDASKETNLAKLEASKNELDYLIKIKAVTQEEGILRTANLEKELSLQKQIQEEANIKSTAAIERANANKKFDIAAQSASGPSDFVAIDDQRRKELETINALEQERINKIKIQYTEKLKLLDVISKEEAQYAKIDSISQTLAKAFEGVGQSASKFGAGIGNVLKTFATIGNKRVAMEKDTQKKLAAIDTNNIDGVIEYYDTQEKAAKKSKEFELEAVAEQAGAAKGLFAEKTFAYKAFAAVEKAIHVAKLVMMAQEMATSLATVGPVVAAEGAKSAAKGTGAILSALNAPFPINFVAGALMAAIVASLLGGSSKSVSIPAGVNAKDVQEVQGTGTSFVNGKKVENGNGVFGDSEAKSESIVKSLEIIKGTSVEGLTFSNKMVNILEKINVGINGAAKTLYSIPGIRTGSQFGTQETTKSSGINGLFGKTVSKNIADSGIKITGLFTDLLNDAKGIIKGYETVSTTTKRSGFLGIGGSTKTSISTQYKELDNAVTSQISEVFSNATDLFVDAGQKLGITAETVFSKLGGIRVDQIASLKDLKGQDLETELNAVLSNILDSAAKTIFSSLDKYREFGEGMLETVVRVVDTNQKVKDSFTSIGRTLGEVQSSAEVVVGNNGFIGLLGAAFKKAAKNLETAQFDITNALAKLSGGLDNFLDSVASYKDAFLSEAEQLVPIQAAVTDELARLGFSTVKTADDFKYLISSLDVATTTGQETFVALLKITDSFARLSAAAEKTDNLRIDLMEAEGKTSEATALRRAKELKEMSATDAELQRRIWLLEDEKTLTADTYSYQYKILQLLNKAEEALALQRAKELDETPEQLRAVQQYIFAIEDEITARDKASKAIDTTISSFKNSVTTLRELRNSLLGGDKSILTPQEKYAQAKQEALAVIEAASAPASSVEDILVREAAISKLPQVTGTWLEASRNLYASSIQYTQDFNTVLAALDSTSAMLDSQLTDAEKQLQVLKDSSNILTTIEDNTRSTNELLDKFLVAAETTRANIATIPTITTTVTNPAIPAANTQANVSQELIAELIKFNKEALEKQIVAQQEAAAAIIRANAAAEAANAAAIVAAQQEAGRQAEWAKKTVPIIDYGYASGQGA